MDADRPGGGEPGPEDRPPLAPPAPPRWRLTPFAATALLAFLSALVVSFLASRALGLSASSAQQLAPDQILTITALSDAALLLALFAGGARLLRIRPPDLGFRRPSLADLRSAVAVAAGLWLVSIAVNAAQIRAFGPHPQALLVSVGAHSGPLALAMDLATGAVIAPLAEETLFRGLIFAGLAQRVPVTAAAAISAFLFAISHGLGVFAPIFVLGLGLAYVYRRTRTIWAPILAHAVVNAVSLVLVFVIPRSL